MIEPTGFSFNSYVNESYPFARAGIEVGTTVTGINGRTTATFQEFSDELAYHEPGERITVQAGEKEYEVVLATSPDQPGKPFLGIQEIANEFEAKEKYAEGGWGVAYALVTWLVDLLRWLFVLSLGIGLFNLLPLPIIDGGRMAQVFLHKLKGPEIGERRYRQISLFFLFILFLNLLPLIMKLF